MDFFNFSFFDFLDITLVGLLLFYVYKLLKGTVAINIFIGISIVFLIYKLTQALKMEMLSNILGVLVGGGAIALIIIFHPELRKFLLMLGSTNFTSKKNFVRQLKFLKSEIVSETNPVEIIKACEKFSTQKTGVLLVFERNNNLDFVKKSGDEMYAQVNLPLLESIFFKNSPLHDGAVVIKDNVVLATRVVLPVSEGAKLPKRYGLRHKAALGITERSDCFCIVVSEETGRISYVYDGTIEPVNDAESLAGIFKKFES